VYNVVIFLIGSSLQTAATTPSRLYLALTLLSFSEYSLLVHLVAGRAIAGLAVGALTHVIPMYLAEISSANIRGSLVALQQLAITFGVSETTHPEVIHLIPHNAGPHWLYVTIAFTCSYISSSFEDWLAYGTSHIGGTRCAPEVPYSGPLLNGSPTFDPYNDVPVGGCTGQNQASWRVPLGFQLFPALVCLSHILVSLLIPMNVQCLGVGMFFMPYSPRWLMEQGREEEALQTLSRLRRKPVGERSVRFEFLEIMAEVRYAREARAVAYPDAGSFRLFVNNYWIFFSSWSKFKRLAVGCLTMFFQQFTVHVRQTSTFSYVLTCGLLGVQCQSLAHILLQLSRVTHISLGHHLLCAYKSVIQNISIAELNRFPSAVFGQLDLNPNTTSLLASGLYGIVNVS